MRVYCNPPRPPLRSGHPSQEGEIGFWGWGSLWTPPGSGATLRRRTALRKRTKTGGLQQLRYTRDSHICFRNSRITSSGLGSMRSGLSG